MENLRSMRLTRHEFRVAIRVNFDPQTRVRLSEFLADLQDFKNDPRFTLRFYPIGKWGGQNDATLDVCGVGQEEEREYLSHQAEQEGFNVESRRHLLSSSNTGEGVCYAARPYNFLVGADGRLMKCTIALEADYNIVGTIGKEGELAVDIDKLMRWTAPYFEDDASCKKCFYLPVCQGCACPLEIIVKKERPCPSDKQRIQKTLQAIWASHRNIAKQKTLREERGSSVAIQ